ncbi:MAG: MmgE/PrpD family protein [Paracoccaceae bacterium]
MSLTDRLSAFVQTARPSQDVLDVMAQSLFDWTACGIAGVGEPVSQIVRAQAFGDGGADQSVLFGGGRVPARAAAFVNGTVSHALDYDDTHFGHIGHPSVAIFSSLCAVPGVKGADLLNAAAVGSEVAVRVGQYLGRDHYQIGFHQTATAGAFGAVAAVARLRALDRDQTAHAFGLTATRAAGLKSQFGTMGKPMNAGLAAECGVICADLAARGMVSNPDALDGPQGFTQTHHGQRDLSAIEDLGQVWRAADVSHKLHACCHGLHAMIEALGQNQSDPSAIQAVHIHTHPRWLSVCNQMEPRTGLQVKFSYTHVAAMVLAGWDTADIASYSEACALDPALIAWRANVTVTGDDQLSESQARVEVAQRDGHTQTYQYDLLDQMQPAQKWAALRRKAKALLGADQEAALYSVLNADKAPDMDALLDVMSR